MTQLRRLSQPNAPMAWPHSPRWYSMFLSFEGCANAKRLCMETTRNAHGELCNTLAQPIVQGVLTILRALELTSPLWYSRYGHQQ